MAKHRDAETFKTLLVVLGGSFLMFEFSSPARKISDVSDLKSSGEKNGANGELNSGALTICCIERMLSPDVSRTLLVLFCDWARECEEEKKPASVKRTKVLIVGFDPRSSDCDSMCLPLTPPPLLIYRESVSKYLDTSLYNIR